MAKNFSLPEMWSTIESRIFKILADLNRNEPNLHRERERERKVWERGSSGRVFQKSPEPFITANPQMNTKGAFILVLTHL